MSSIKDLLREIMPQFFLDFLWEHNIASTKNPVRNFLKSVRWRTHQWLNKDIIIQTPRGFRYISMPHNFSSRVVYFRDYRDPPIQYFMEQRIGKGSTFVDAGANIGTYTVPASKLVGDEGRIIAIEAHPFTYKYLLKNIELNDLKNVSPVKIALGAEYGNVELAYDESNPGETHVAAGENKKITVPLSTLDEVLDGLKVTHVDYLKIDVEGFEYPLLLGARKTIENNKDIVIQTELNEHHANRYGNPLLKTIEFMRSFELVPHVIDSNGKAHATDLSNLREEDVLWWRE